MNILAFERKQREVSRLNSEFGDFVTAREPLSADPPSSNTGGNSPLPIDKGFASRVKIDWLAFTTNIHHNHIKESIRCFFPNVSFEKRDNGMYGYPDSYDLVLDDVSIGLFCYGASHGRDYVSITGRGASLWPVGAYPFIRDCLHTISAVLTRVDLAFDTYRGEVTHDMLDSAYRDGQFKLRQGGRNPERGDRGTQVNGVNMGRTIYVGKRDSSKFLRGYEKGLEVFSKLGEDFRERCTEPGQLVYDTEKNAPVGTIADQWYRVEVQYMNKDKDLQLEILTECESYFAGAYPFCASVLGLGDGKRPDSLKPSPLVDFEKMLKACRGAYGNFIHTLKDCGFSNDEIVQFLDTGIPNSRLVSSGLVSLVQNDPAWKLAMLQSQDVPF